MKVDIVAILKVGLSGLAFLLAGMSYLVLSKEQSARGARPPILTAARRFMWQAIVLAVVVGVFGLADVLLRDRGRKVSGQEVHACKVSLAELSTNSKSAVSIGDLRSAVAVHEQHCRSILDALDE